MLTNALKTRPHHRMKKLIKAWYVLLVVIGFCLIVLALLSYLAELPLLAIFQWLQRMFGTVFVVIFSLLIALAVFAISQLKPVKADQKKTADYWHEVAQQAGNGIATLALTFTLLGISLGISTLAEHPLTPDNIQTIIGVLTKQFSMAFMTTVVGLPTATLVRALASIKYQQSKLFFAPQKEE